MQKRSREAIAKVLAHGQVSCWPLPGKRARASESLSQPHSCHLHDVFIHSGHYLSSTDFPPRTGMRYRRGQGDTRNSGALT